MSSTIKQAIQALKGRIEDAYAAVSQKGGTLPATQDSASLPAAIASIPSGGGAIEAAKTINRGGELGDYVIFFDIDGSILFAYTPQEIQELDELPVPYVTHEGLTFDRWSWTLAELKADPTWHDVGAHYYPTDGYGQLELDYRDSKNMLTPHIGVKMRTSDGLIVDWGDGTIETLPAALEFDLQHTYAQAGKYLMKYKQANDAKIYGIYVWEDTKKHVVGRCVYPTNAECISCSPLTGQTENTNRSSQQGIAGTFIEELAIPYTCLISDNNSSCGLHLNMPLLRAASGNCNSGVWRGIELLNFQFLSLATFVSFRNVEMRTNISYVPIYVRSFEMQFSEASSIPIPMPRNNNIERIKGKNTTGNIRGGAYSSAMGGYNGILAPKLRSLPPVDLSYGYSAGGISSSSLETAPQFVNIVSWRSLSFSNCYKIRDWGIELGEGTKVRTNMFENNYSLRTATIKAKSVVSANMFLNCGMLEEVHIKTSIVEHGAISTLNNINAFSGTPSYMKIYVPADSVNDYKAATNWATYANQIFAEPTT